MASIWVEKILCRDGSNELEKTNGWWVVLARVPARNPFWVRIILFLFGFIIDNRYPAFVSC